MKTNGPASNEKVAFDQKDILVYRYHDASKPAEFHRSYTISVMPHKVLLTVDVYGKILATYTSTITNVTYKSFVISLVEAVIKVKEGPSEVSPVGCITEHLCIRIGKLQLRGYICNLKSEIKGCLQGDVLTVINLFKALVPKLEKKIRI